MTESKLKQSAMDSVGELPNLLLRECGYSHLPEAPITPAPTIATEMLNVLIQLYKHGYTTGEDHRTVRGVIKKAIGEVEFEKIDI